MTSTVITYNGVSIGYVRVLSLTADSVYDDSGVILVGVRKSISFRGLIQNPDSTTYAAAVQTAQASLMVPRKALTIVVNGVTLTSVGASGGGGTYATPTAGLFDAASGPIPSNVTVQNVVGGRASFVTMTLDWTEPPDSITAESEARILSHRFEQSWGIDDRGYAARTVRGVLVLNGKFGGVNPDAFRQWVIPAEIAGFRRSALEFAVSPDGKSLIYQCSDSEGFRPYPNGVLRADGTVTAVSVGGTGAMRKNVSFTIEADKYFPKNKLLLLAWDVLGSRINLEAGGDLVESVSISENMWGANSVAISCQAMVKRGESARDSRFDIASSGLFRQIGSVLSDLESKGRFRQVNSYGQALVYSAVQAMFYAPTDGNPEDPDEIASATALRWSREDNLIDSDGDDYAENFTELETVTGVDVVAAELPDDYDGTVLDLFIGGNRIMSGGDPFYSDDAVGRHPYTVVETHKVQTLSNNWNRVRTADPSKPDRMIQHGSPTVFIHHSGVLRRKGAMPEVFVPKELTEGVGASGAENDKRRFVLHYREVAHEDPRPMANGQDIEYGVRYEYLLEQLYVPENDDFTASTTLRFKGIGDENGRSIVTTFDGSKAITAAHQPVLNPNWPVAPVDPSLEGSEYV